MDGEAGGATARLDGRARYCRAGSPAMNDTSAPGGRRTRVALGFGRRAGEHAIVCATAAGVLRALAPQRYVVLPIGIPPDGQWVLTAADPDALALGGAELPSVPASSSDVVLPMAQDRRDLTVTEPGQVPRSLGEEIGRAHVSTPVTSPPRMPSSA